MTNTRQYYLTEEEGLMLGCLKMQVVWPISFFILSQIYLYPLYVTYILHQADSGDYDASIHTIPKLQIRISTSFPSPIRDRMKVYLTVSEKKDKKVKEREEANKAKAQELCSRVILLYSRLAGTHFSTDNFSRINRYHYRYIYKSFMRFLYSVIYMFFLF
jgi:hypothetical protein